MKSILSVILLLLPFSALAGNYLIPVDKSLLSFRSIGYRMVCVLETCYYVADKEGVDRLIAMGAAKKYYPVVERKISAAQPNDNNFYKQWWLKDSTTNWLKAWDSISTLDEADSNSPIVAVIDTGMSDHTDMPLSGATIFNNKYYDTNDNDGIDINGHGTAVAGIIAANTNNSKGVASISAGRVRIVSIKVSQGDSDKFTDADMLSAINLILELKEAGAPIYVVNMSFSGGYSIPEENAIKQLYDAGIIVVAAAGNEKENLQKEPTYPACLSVANVVGVAATDSNSRLADFSNYGPQIGIAAPGNNVLVIYMNNEYAYVDGTSFSAPITAAAIAAAIAIYDRDKASAIYPDIGPAQLLNMLYDSATTNTNLKSKVFNAKQLNIGSFIQAVENCRETAKGSGCTVSDIYPERHTNFDGENSVPDNPEVPDGPVDSQIPVPDLPIRTSDGGGGCSITGTAGGYWDILAMFLLGIFLKRRFANN